MWPKHEDDMLTKKILIIPMLHNWCVCNSGTGVQESGCSVTGMVPITSLEGQGTQQSEGRGKVWIKKEEKAAYAGERITWSQRIEKKCASQLQKTEPSD